MEVCKKIKQFFCKHDFEEIGLKAFRNIDGWLVPVSIFKCKKCGYMKEAEK